MKANLRALFCTQKALCPVTCCNPSGDLVCYLKSCNPSGDLDCYLKWSGKRTLPEVPFTFYITWYKIVI